MARMRDKSKEKRTKRRGGGSKHKCNPATTAVCIAKKEKADKADPGRRGLLVAYRGE